MKKKIIPVNRPKIYSPNNSEIKKALRDKWISGDGPVIEKFEKKFKGIIKKNYAIAVSNGTSALEIALASLKLKKGSKVILPNLTIVSCLNAIIRNNLKPIFVDVSVDDFNICINDLKKKISSDVKALIMVHTYGLAANIQEINKLLKQFKKMSQMMKKFGKNKNMDSLMNSPQFKNFNSLIK